MPAPKAKNAASNGAGAKAPKEAKATKESKALPTPSATTSGKTSPVPPEDGKQSSAHRGRPDKAAYDAEQDSIKKEIDALQVKMVRRLNYCIFPCDKISYETTLECRERKDRQLFFWNW